MNSPATLIFAPLLLITTASAVSRATVGSVTDGDTFRLTTSERIRIANINAP